MACETYQVLVPAIPVPSLALERVECRHVLGTELLISELRPRFCIEDNAVGTERVCRWQSPNPFQRCRHTCRVFEVIHLPHAACASSRNAEPRCICDPNENCARIAHTACKNH